MKSIPEIRQRSLITAIKTPFNEQGKVDISAFDYLIETQIQNQVDGIIVGGTTGEGHLLDWEEHLMLIAHAASHYGEQLLIVGNTGSNNTREAIKATEYGFASGMHAALQINPYYGKTTQQGVERHIKIALDIGPAFIYNVPSRTGQDICPDTIYRLSEHANFIGVKECVGNSRIAELESNGIACWSGNDDECFESRHRFNSHGVISVVSNIVPGLMRKLIDKDDLTANEALSPLINWLFSEPNPICLNTALAMLGAIKPVFRLPYLPLTVAQQEQGKALLEQFTRDLLPGTGAISILDPDKCKVLV